MYYTCSDVILLEQKSTVGPSTISMGTTETAVWNSQSLVSARAEIRLSVPTLCCMQHKSVTNTGKRGRGAEGHKPVLFAVQNNGNLAGYMYARVVDRVEFRSVE